MEQRSEIRDSMIRDLLEKTQKMNYKEYLSSIRLERIRKFNGSQINFSFPVTALIGPNGGGKSTIIGLAILAYQTSKPSNIFRKCIVGDDSMKDWEVEFEVIDKKINNTGTQKFSLSLLEENNWKWSDSFKREVKFLSINRTVPIGESSYFSYRKKISTPTLKSKKQVQKKFTQKKVENISSIKLESEKILGKSLNDFSLYEFYFPTKNSYRKELVGMVKTKDGKDRPKYKSVLIEPTEDDFKEKQILFVSSDGINTYSEFNFGSGETSIIRMVAEMESLPDGALVLIEEIENGIHPIAVRRVVEYFIELAHRKKLQIIFTTHSDYAIDPLPSEAIWACLDGKLQQGKLSIEALRAVTGRFDRKLAIFVEDNFAKTWIEYILRIKLNSGLEEIGIFALGGDGNAVKIHESHALNPSIEFKSICIIDGDSKQSDNSKKKIFRLPGDAPESTVFNSVIRNLPNNLVQLTVSCQVPIFKQDLVSDVIKEVSRTNRDPHLLFSQIGLKLGFISEEIIQGAFLSIWSQENPEEVDKIYLYISEFITNN